MNSLLKKGQIGEADYKNFFEEGNTAIDGLNPDRGGRLQGVLDVPLKLNDQEIASFTNLHSNASNLIDVTRNAAGNIDGKGSVALESSVFVGIGAVILGLAIQEDMHPADVVVSQSFLLM